MLTKPAPYLFNGIERENRRELDQAEIGKSSAHSMVCHPAPSMITTRMTTPLFACKCCFITSVYQRPARLPVVRLQGDGTEEIELLLLELGGDCPPGPQSGSRILLTKPGFVLKPDIDIGKRNMTQDVKDRFQLEVFKASCLPILLRMS